jgi:hypothetical protein
VRRECLTAALVNNERSGIWGGLSGKERRRLRRTASAAAIAAAPLPPIVYTSVARAESIAERRSNGGRFTRAEANRAAIAATVVEIGPRRATGRILEGANADDHHRRRPPRRVSIPNVPGATLELLELESVRTGRSRGELVALAVAAMFAPPIEDPAPLGEAPGQGTTRPPAPVTFCPADLHATSTTCDRLTLLSS